MSLENLETRETPTIGVVNNPIGAQPAWQSVGPTAIQTNEPVAANVQIGGANSVAIDPFNPSRAVLGTVNGGAWFTADYTSANPVWTATTDALPSLAISTVAYNPIQPNVVYAGTGSFTAGGLGVNGAAGTVTAGTGGAPVGVYRSTDGGQTWAQIGGGTFNGLRIRDLVPTRLNGGQTIFAAVSDKQAGPTSTDIFRSDNGGTSWVRVSNVDGLPNLQVSSLIADPGNANRFYAAMISDPAQASSAAAGVYVLDTTGGNTRWSNITSNLPAAAVRTSLRILLTSTAVGVNPVYCAVLDLNGTPVGVYRSVAFGATYIWTAVGPAGRPPDVNPGNQAEIHSSLIADPTSDRIVYFGGDTTARSPFVGSIARGDALANTWTTITLQSPGLPPASPGTVIPLNTAPAPTTAPHADLRRLVFAGNNVILAVGDGGIYQVTNPRAVGGTPPVWTSLNSNLQTSELYAAAVDNRQNTDPTDDVYLHAAQDNGSGQGVVGGPYTDVSGGDGALVLADTQNGFRYFSAQNFFYRRQNPNGSISTPPGTVAGSGGRILNPAAPGVLIENLSFNPVAALSQQDMNTMLVGGFGTLYLSLNNGDTFRSLGGVVGGLPIPVTNVTGLVTAIAFGTSQIPLAAYVATDDGNISRSFDVSSGNGNFVVTNFKTVALGAMTYNVVMDPNNPLIAYAVTDKGVFRTLDGNAWTNVTGNLLSLVNLGGLVTLYGAALFNNNTLSTGDDSLLVGAYGGVFQLRQTSLFGGVWTKLGTGIPNVVVSSVYYDPLSDSLMAGTYGRGIWRIPDAGTTLLDNGVTVVVTGNNSPNNMSIWKDPTAGTNNFLVTDGIGAQQSFDQTVYRRVQFKGLGGADVIRVGAPDAATPAQTFQLQPAITVDAGSSTGDTLIIEDSGDAAGRIATGTPNSIGGGKTDTLFAKGGKVTFSGLNLGGTQVRFGAGTDSYTIDDNANTAPTGYNLSSTRYSRSAAGSPIDYSGVETMTLVGGTGTNTYAITGTGAATRTAVFDGSGDSTMNVQGAGLTGSNFFIGNAGTDRINLFGRASNDSLTLQLTDLVGSVSGSGTLGTLGFQTFEAVSFDGNGGIDNLNWLDATNTSFGTPTDPDSGIVYLPGAGLSGQIKVNRGNTYPVVNFAALSGGLSINGDANGTGTPDVLAVYGISDTGRASGIGEVTAVNGSDTITASDSLITISNSTFGALRSVSLGQTAGGATFSTVFVRAGNEAGPGGDLVTVTPSTLINLVVDGMGPTSGQPGDRITVLVDGTQTRTPTSDPTFGPPQIRIVQDADGASVGSIGFESSGGAGSSVIVVASDAGTETRVRVFDAVTRVLKFEFVPFPGFAGGASVASGDFNGDGIADVVVGAGPGGGPQVSVYDGGSGALLSSFFAFEDTFTGGVNVSAADFNRDGIADIAIGTGIGGGPRIQIRNGRTRAIIRDVLVYEETFRGGVSVAAGDVNGDGTPDLVTSAGVGGGPRVVIFDGRNLQQIASFFVFDQNLRTGFYIASGDVTGDGFADIIAGSGAGVPAQVRILSGRNLQVVADFIVNDPFDPTSSVPYIPVDGGVRVTTADVNNDQIPDVVTAKGPGSSSTIRVYQIGSVNPVTNALQAGLSEITRFDAFEDTFGFGVFVGGN